MRMPWNRNDALWGGFTVRGPEGTVYHSGDTAWGDHFAEIKARVTRELEKVSWKTKLIETPQSCLFGPRHFPKAVRQTASALKNQHS